AEGAVKFSLLDAKGWRINDLETDAAGEGKSAEGPTELAADRLHLDLPQGVDGPAELLVEGNVSMNQSGEAMTANRLRALLTPGDDESTQMAVSDVEASDVTILTGENGRI